MGIKQKNSGLKEEFTEFLAAKIASRIIVKSGGLFLAGEDGGALDVLAQGDDGQEGQRGPRGLTGEEGPIGLKGDDGPIGPRGEKGVQGNEGKQGQTGQRGETGEKGNDATGK